MTCGGCWGTGNQTLKWDARAAVSFGARVHGDGQSVWPSSRGIGMAAAATIGGGGGFNGAITPAPCEPSSGSGRTLLRLDLKKRQDARTLSPARNVATSKSRQRGQVAHGRRKRGILRVIASAGHGARRRMSWQGPPEWPRLPSLPLGRTPPARSRNPMSFQRTTLRPWATLVPHGGDSDASHAVASARSAKIRIDMSGC